MAKEQIVKVKTKYSNGNKMMTGFCKLRNNDEPEHIKIRLSTFFVGVGKHGNQIGLWTWYKENGNISKEIIYIP